VEPAGWGAAFFDLGAIAAFRLGLMEEAYAFALAACQQEPGDIRLAENLDFIAKELEERAKGREHGTL